MADDAIAQAKELDEHFKKTGKLVGPLVSYSPWNTTYLLCIYVHRTNSMKHGVPISVKEHIGLKGRICHTGYVAW